MNDNETRKPTPEYEVNWTPRDCPHSKQRQGMRHLHPQDCFAFEIAVLHGEAFELRDVIQELAEASGRMDCALADYWNACNDISSCGDPECDGDCSLRTWEEFECARIDMRNALARVNRLNKNTKGDA